MSGVARLRDQVDGIGGALRQAHEWLDYLSLPEFIAEIRKFIAEPVQMARQLQEMA